MTRAEQQQLTRQRLLDATLGVVRRTGLPDATIEEITELAGYTRGAFYAHFESKEAALLEVFEQHVDTQVEAFRDRVTSARSEAAAFRAMTSVLMPPTDESRSRTGQFGEFTAAVFRSEDLRVRALALQTKIELVLGQCVEHLCERRGTNPPRPRAELGILVGALLDGLAARQRLDPELRADRLFGEALDLMIGA
jgi:AcrR family transcriptional regulator